MFVRISLAALIAGSFGGTLAHADPLREAAESAAACRAISEDASRLICLDAAAVALSTALGEFSASPTATPAAPSTPEWASAPETETVAPVVAEAPSAVAATEIEAKQKKPPLWARVFNPDEEQGEDEVVSVEIVRVIENNVGRHFFITADGQEWRQTVKGKVRTPKNLPAAASIQRESYGSPALSFDSRPNKTYRVRRVK